MLDVSSVYFVSFSNSEECPQWSVVLPILCDTETHTQVLAERLISSFPFQDHRPAPVVVVSSPGHKWCCEAVLGEQRYCESCTMRVLNHHSSSSSVQWSILNSPGRSSAMEKNTNVNKKKKKQLSIYDGCISAWRKLILIIKGTSLEGSAQTWK